MYIIFLPVAIHSYENISLTVEISSKNDLWMFQEGDTINVDVTCPGATLALAMIYLKTNNR